MKLHNDIYRILSKINLMMLLKKTIPSIFKKIFLQLKELILIIYNENFVAIIFKGKRDNITKHKAQIKIKILPKFSSKLLLLYRLKLSF